MSDVTDNDARSDRSERYLPQEWILPLLTEENRPFFTSGKLMLQTCMSCGTIQHPPGEFCFECRSLELTHTEVPARGEVVATTIVHHAVHPILRDVVPYNAVVVEIDGHEGIRVLGNVIEVANEEVTIGMQVEGTWAAVRANGEDKDEPEDLLLLQWKPVNS